MSFPTPPEEPFNPYQGSSYEPASSAPMTTGNGGVALWLGVTSLICGFVGLMGFCCGLFWVFCPVGVVTGAAAIFMGYREMKAVDAGWSHPSQRGQALSGAITGAIGLVMCLLMIGLFVFRFGLMALGGFFGG